MRQVPHYLIIGNGRVARHMQRYFSLLSLSYTTWHRTCPLSQLYEQISLATHVLILIKDSEIAPFIDEHLQGCGKPLVHFSGSLVIEGAFGAHPLMSFTEGSYDLAQYQAMPFVLDHDAPAFDALLPGLANHHVRLHTSLKPKYHALCVLSGNFSCLLWQKLFDAFENEFHIHPSVAHVYLTQQTHQLLAHPHRALTGPLVRGDAQTIEKNILALEGDPYQEVYKSFVDCYQKIMLQQKRQGEVK